MVEKCKLLQESNCKGMCLNIFKLPAQDFFRDTLGVPLTVSPNFETQECQWSFGRGTTTSRRGFFLAARLCCWLSDLRGSACSEADSDL